MAADPLRIVVEAFESGWSLRSGDKYDMEDVETGAMVDCENRLHLCHAACCTFDVTLSLQDVVEGVLEWDPADPYRLRHGDDGRCAHLDGSLGGCAVYAQRPSVCRAYSCRSDARVWLDFDRYQPAPDLETRLAERGRSGGADPTKPVSAPVAWRQRRG